MQITTKTNQASIKAGEIIKLIRQWKRNGVTDAIIPKLLVLYFGESAYMNNELIYPKENFYDIRIALHFNNTTRMLVDIRRSGSFGITGNMDSMGITNFYSLFIHKGKIPTQNLKENCQVSDDSQNDSSAASSVLFSEAISELPLEDSNNNLWTDLPSNCSQNKLSSNCSPSICSEDNIIYNNITKGEALAAANIPIDFTKEAKEFFHLLNEDAELRKQMLLPLISEFEKKERLSRKNARRCLVYLVNEILIPYFARKKEFGQMPHEGRICWLRNLLKAPVGTAFKTKSAAAVRVQREQEATEFRQTLKTNRPLSPHEWQNPTTETRWYDDAKEGDLQIPAQAPPRPTDTAWWDVIDEVWKET